MNHWPSLRHYDENSLDRFAMPLGGIGTGTISLGGRGDFRDCEIMNKPAKNDTGIHLFFCLQANGECLEKPFAKLLEGPIPDYLCEGPSGSMAPHHGLPKFRHVSADAAYPLAQVSLFESSAPVEVTLQAFNPLVPVDSDASGYPAAVLRYVVKNKTPKPLDVSVCGTASNTLGVKSPEVTRKNTFSSGKGHQGLAGLAMTTQGAPNAGDNRDGDVVLATPDHGDITWRECWGDLRWSVPLLKFWDDFADDGRLEPVDANVESYPLISLCLRKTIPANGEMAYTFILAWRFPNRRTWTPLEPKDREGIDPAKDPDVIGNYYCTRFPRAWDAAIELNSRLAELEEKTIDFVTAFLQSPVPDYVKEAALFNISTLRSQTVFRTPDGRMFGWEGCFNTEGSCFGSCTHVWNYEQTTPFLFGALARGMRETEFLHALVDDGMMFFRVPLPLERVKVRQGRAAADGQMGCIMKVYREWKLSGDDEFLKRLWPAVKKALAFCWVKGGWDGDCDGVMEGCQHNTMDVEYYGPNAQMQGWYLGALKSAQLMAEYLKDDDFAEKCRNLFQAGAAAMDTQLFNGEYYEQRIMPPHSVDNIYPGLALDMGTRDFEHPTTQLGKACLVDQLVGPYMAKVIGLPNLLDPAHVRKTLESIYRYNRIKGVYDHFNNMRSFVCNDEPALLMASYPHGERPDIPFPYFTEVMTGFEYTAAVGMLYEGMEREGLQVIHDIRARYNGKRRSPFDEAECGHHYARAMAAWAAYLALSQFHYDGCTGEMAIKDAEGSWFWSTGNAYGTCAILAGKVRFSVLGGSVKLNKLHVGDRTFQVGDVLTGRTTIRLQ